MSSTEALPNKILPNNDLGIIEEIAVSYTHLTLPMIYSV